MQRVELIIPNDLWLFIYLVTLCTTIFMLCCGDEKMKMILILLLFY